MKKLRLPGIVIFTLLILFLLTKFYLPHFLSYQKPVDSKIFLIEAWISSWEIEQAVKDYGNSPDSRFYIVGYQYPKIQATRVKANRVNSPEGNNNKSGVWLYANSSLGFSLPSDLNMNPGDSIKIIVIAKGQEAAGHFAYFNVVINGECIGGDFTQTNYREYSYDWIVQDEGINTCYIKFNNDLVENNTDRNLNIKVVQIGDHLFTANKNSTTLVRDLNNLTSGFGSQAEEVRNYLLKLGIDQKKITIVNFEPVTSNQTLAAAEKFKTYLASSSLPSINVITTDIHSRRTWLTYKRVLGTKTNVGVLYYPYPIPERIRELRKYPDLFYIMNEYLAYLANWIMLTF